MRAAHSFNSRFITRALISLVFILGGCAPRIAAQPTPLIPPTGPTEPKPTIEAPTVEPTEASLNITLTAAKSAATILQGGRNEIEVEEEGSIVIEPGDRMEIGEPNSQEDQSHSLLQVLDDLQVELFTNTVMLLEEVQEEAGTLEHVKLVLTQGHVVVEPENQIVVHVTVQTPDATITTLEDGTKFRICAVPETLTCLQVKSGAVEISAHGMTETVQAGEAILVNKGEAASAVICAPNEIFDDWESQYREDGTTPALDGVIAGLQELCAWQSLDLPPDVHAIYQDQFTNPLSGWRQENTDNYFIGYSTPEYYHIQLQSPGAAALVEMPNGSQYGDFNLDLKALTGSARAGDFQYGVAFRQAEESYYAFVLSPSTQKWYVLKSSSDGLQVLREDTDEGIQGMESEDVLRVVARGSVFTFFINGQLVFQLTNPDYESGEVALLVRTVDSPGALIYFDSITLWDLQAPTPTANVNVNATPLKKENCFNNRDDDGDHFIDRDDSDCRGSTVLPSQAPPPAVTDNPTDQPTEAPTVDPTDKPTDEPTQQPTDDPTEAPTHEATPEPIIDPPVP